MEFSNPFDNPQGRFWLLENHEKQISLWPEPCALPPADFAHRNETRG